MNVHLIVRYRELNNQLPDHSQKDLVRLTVEKMARPCVYTAITTIIAFLSLLMADIKPVIDFGLMMTLGLTVVYATTFFVSFYINNDKKDKAEIIEWLRFFC